MSRLDDFINNDFRHLEEKVAGIDRRGAKTDGKVTVLLALAGSNMVAIVALAVAVVTV